MKARKTIKKREHVESTHRCPACRRELKERCQTALKMGSDGRVAMRYA